MTAALSAITAAVVGVVANLSVWFAVHTIFRDVRPAEWGPISFPTPVLSTVDGLSLAIAAAALLATLRFKLGLAYTLGGAALVGVIGRYVLAGG